MKGHDGDLEPDAREDEGQGQEDHRQAAGIGVGRGQGPGDLEGAGHGIEEADAEGQKRRGHRAHDEIFQPRLIAVRFAFPDGDEDIEGQGHQLQAQEEDHPIGPGHHQHHPQGGKDQEGVQFIPGKTVGYTVLAHEEQGDDGNEHQDRREEPEVAAQVQQAL